MGDLDLQDDDDRRLCHECIGEAYLSDLVATAGVVATCTYCQNDEEPCFTLEQLADEIEGAFDRHYYRTSDQPNSYESMLQRDKESDYEFERHGELVVEVIAEAASISDDAAKDILEILEERHSDFDAAQIGEECEFDSESHYEWKDAQDHEYAREWRDIEYSLKSHSRYFNHSAEAFLSRLFSNLDGSKTRKGHPVVVIAGPEAEHKSFFRARVFHKSDDLDQALQRPDLHLGPPPAKFARAGRMNAHGISMFYGASDKGVALAEVRPPVGSRALIGEFELTRPVRLLDVSELHSVYVEGSIFDPGHVDRLGLAKFMQRLSDRITRPVMPDDETTEYLITQMIADYLARQPEPALDGILFPSVQCPGDHRNVVLFHHAARVDALPLPEGTELSSRQYMTDEDGDHSGYSVFERVPKPQPEAKPEKHAGGFGDFDIIFLSSQRPESDPREVTLRARTQSMTAHHVSGVAFTTDEYEVHRHRIERRDWQGTRAKTPPSDFDF
ncbi:RES domain-containing protein (plasmid) [Rhizobium leguminosarum]|nr:RES domain-containing protein [Rhizobium leguminosarum]